MKEWTYEAVIQVISEALLETIFAKETDMTSEEAILIAKSIATKLEGSY